MYPVYEDPCVWREFGGWNKAGCGKNLPCRAQALAFSDCLNRISSTPWHARPNIVSECNALAGEFDMCLSSAPEYVKDIFGHTLNLYAVAYPSFRRRKNRE